MECTYFCDLNNFMNTYIVKEYNLFKGYVWREDQFNYVHYTLWDKLINAVEKGDGPILFKPWWGFILCNTWYEIWVERKMYGIFYFSTISTNSSAIRFQKWIKNSFGPKEFPSWKDRRVLWTPDFVTNFWMFSTYEWENYMFKREDNAMIYLIFSLGVSKKMSFVMMDSFFGNLRGVSTFLSLMIS